MDRSGILEQIRNERDLLSLPQVISELLHAIDSANLRSDLLANIILKDPNLTGRLLRFANSPYYHRYSRPTTVHQAVQILGMATVKCLALSSSVLNPSQFKNSLKVDSKAYFSGVLSVAVTSEKIARAAGMKATEEAFICGLLHDIGVLFFVHHYPTSYKNIVDRKTNSDSLSEAEKKTFAIDHTEVGRELARRWNLPADICTAIGSHHDYQSGQAGKDLPTVLKLAVLLCQESIEGYDPDPIVKLHGVEKIREALGLTGEQLEMIISSIMPDTIKLSSFLDADIGTVDEILARANKEMWRSFLTVQNLFKERQELTRQLLLEERQRGAIESKNIAIATLSHYINNATAGWYGHIQLLRQKLNRQNDAQLIKDLPASLDVMENAIKRILAVIAEIKEISPIDDVSFYHMSQAMNIDERVVKRLKTMSIDSEVVTAEEQPVV